MSEQTKAGAKRTLLNWRWWVVLLPFFALWAGQLVLLIAAVAGELAEDAASYLKSRVPPLLRWAREGITTKETP